MRKFFICLISIMALISCEKQFEEPLTQREYNYNTSFEDYIGKPYNNQEWGDWTLTLPSSTRTVNNDTTTWDRFKSVEYPPQQDIYDIITEFGRYYDGINLVNLPAGDYWVKIIYRNNYFFYTDYSWFTIFRSAEKMSSVSVYSQAKKMYEKINNVDSLALIEYLDEYDGVMPQFAYFNELYSENYFDQRTIFYNGVYYVGFDFFVDGFYRSGGSDYTVLDMHGKDCIYDDIIMMLIPAYRYGQEEVYDEKRVICEDLSNNLDFDFNDLVYDVALVNLDGELKTRITIQAIGTPNSINIAGREAHDILDVTNSVCVNTYGKEGHVTREPKSFYLDKIFTDIRDIEVSVFYDNKIHFLSSKKGSIPTRICVSTNYRWCYGELGIFLAYPNFKEWATKGYDGNWEDTCREELVFK